MALDDLSKWNFSIEFLLYEAAALIVGIDPAEVYVNTDPAKDNQNIYDYHEYPLIKPVVDRMKYDYFSAADLYTSLHKGAWRYASPAPLPESVLRSREMEVIPLQINAACLPLDQASQEILDNWRVSDEDCGTYEVVKFTRQELSRWLCANRFESIYRFDLSEKIAAKTALANKAETKLAESLQPEKPLSTRERTAYLNIIGALMELIKTPKAGRSDDASVIKELVENYSDKYGISPSNLNRKIPEARRSLTSS